MFQPTVNIDEFVTLSNAGVKVASFVQVRDALVNRYRSIYGSDIDLSTGSADGVFVNDLALIINNILQCISTMYNNLDVNTASGKYLDILCALSNVTRKKPTKSYAYLTIENISNVDVTITQQNPEFVDQSGTSWFADTVYTIASGDTASIKVICEKAGPIEAPAGWITNTIEALGTIAIEQPNNAIVGLNEESDAELRFRRAQSSGAAGVTTIDALIGALLDVTGIRDVKVINYNKDQPSTPETATDGTTMLGHSVYVILRLDDGIEIADSTIGSIIYEKLTPGVRTCECAISADSKSYEYIAEINNIHAEAASQMVYWKEATPINPTITLTITALPYFSSDEIETIAQNVIKYMNALTIDTKVSNNELLIQTVYADPTFKGKPTYITVSASAASHSNNLTYYKYTSYTHSTSGDDIVITIS